MYAGDLVLISEAIVELRNKYIKYKESFDNMVLKVILETTMMVTEGIAKGRWSN